MARPGQNHENPLGSIQGTWAQISALVLRDLGPEIESPSSEDLFPGLKTGNNKSYLRVLRQVNEMIHMQHNAWHIVGSQ